MSSDALTPAEARVAALVQSGLTNREIANSLRLSESTVKNHLNAIYGKGGDRAPVNRDELREACYAGTLGVGYGAPRDVPPPPRLALGPSGPQSAGRQRG